MLLSKKLKDPRTVKPSINKNFATLKEYRLDAEKCIKYWCGRHYPYLVKTFLSSEERISDIMYELMVADWEWDTSRGMSLHNYRNNRAFWAIKNLAGRLRLHKHKCCDTYLSELESKNCDGKRLNFEEVLYKSTDPRYHSLNPAAVSRQQEVQDQLNDCLSLLSDREREIATLHYLEGKTFREIATEITPAISFQRVGQILEKVASKLEGAFAIVS